MMKKIVFKIICLLFLLITSCKTEFNKLKINDKAFIFVKGLKDDRLQIEDFYIASTPVTVAQFTQFVRATGYQTEADKWGNAGIFDLKKKDWTMIEGANWAYPFGKDAPRSPPNHPVTQVSWADATAYAKWSNARLPTVIEWEWAATNGGESWTRYAWGNEIKENGMYKANIWQGLFPHINQVEDGYQFTSPVGAYPASPLGLYDIVGNVWEWTSDWKIPQNIDYQSFVPDSTSEKILKGGSFLCEPNWCHGYTYFGQTACTPETSLFHIGFRVVKGVE